MRLPAPAAAAALLILTSVGSSVAPAAQPAEPPPVGPPVPPRFAPPNRANPQRVAPPALGPRVLPRRIPRLRMRLDEDAPDRPPLAIDRQIAKEMETAGELIGKQQYSEGIHHLQHVLDTPEDSWIEVPGPHGPVFQSAKRLAADRIGSLPAPRANPTRPSSDRLPAKCSTRRRDAATAPPWPRSSADTSRPAPATKPPTRWATGCSTRRCRFPRRINSNGFASRRAAPPSSPCCLLRSLSAGSGSALTEKCAALLSEMKQRQGDTVTIGGHKATIPDGAERAQWVAQLIGPPAASKTIPVRDWMLTGGAPDRNAQSGDALPIGKAVWTQSLIRDRDLGVKDRFAEIEATLEEYRRELTESDSLAIPSGSPLVIGNTVVFRTFARLRAVDLRTGDPLWDFAERDRYYGVLAANHYQTRRSTRLPISLELTPDDLRLFFGARAFRDMTHAGLSSDGERVFAITEGGFLGLGETERSDQNESLGARNHNVLCAVDVATGRLLWELGGTRSDRNRDLAGTFFLGCGLPMGSALYAMGELDGDVSLYKIDAATGKRIYTQRLAAPLGRLPHYPLRRLAGGNPSWAAGLLICPITGGVVTAFDPAARTLAWEYRYHVNRPGDPRDWTDAPLDTGEDEKSRWLDTAPLIVEGAALLTPRDSDELHCLNLSDGTLRWKHSRGNGLFLAGANDGVVCIVGRSGLEALNLKDGSNAWSQSVELGSPSGRGYRSGPFYHLPLATGELATIDLRHGRIVTRTRFETGVHPGNLVSAEGTVLMESAGALEGFRPTAELENSIAQTLEQHPDDASALATRGELRLHRGQADAGLADLTHSVRLQPDSRVQAIAVATVLENLRYDFAGSRALAERYGPQIIDSGQRVEFHRLMAAGLSRGGDLEAALEHELDLVQRREFGRDPAARRRGAQGPGVANRRARAA